MLPLKLIAAVDAKNGLSKDGALPWSLAGDQKYFKEMTKYATVVMGWQTFMDMGKEPLPDRHNVILSQRHVTLRADCEVIHNLENYLKKTREDIWIVGGATVFEQTLPWATHLYITRIDKDFGCDKFFPEFRTAFDMLTCSAPITENGLTYRFETWIRKPGAAPAK